MRNGLVNGALVVLSVLATLAMGECVVRALTGGGASVRTLYFSPNALQTTENGAVHYRPSSRVHTMAVYDGVADYDVTFPVNNLGYVDSTDYQPTAAEKAVAVVGDSFTAGYHGGEPWVPKLRDMPNLRGRPVYNLGVDGVGTEAFLKLLQHAGKTLAFDTVLMVGLSGDFARVVWRPVEQDGRLWLCPGDLEDERCRATPTAIEILDGKSHSLPAANQNGTSIADPVREAAQALLPALFRLQHELRMSRRMANELPSAASKVFFEFRQWGGSRKLLFLHMPMREEVLRNAFVADIRNAAEENGISYISGLDCGLLPSDFFSRDPHPNAAGYDKIRACAAAILARGTAR